MRDLIPKILAAVPMTLLLTLAAMFFGSLLGLLLALAKVYRVPVLKQFASAYVSVMRGIPLVVQLYISYYVLPGVIVSVGARLGASIQIKDVPSVLIAVIAFSLDEAAYLSETFRSSLEAVDRGQLEAAYAVGMTRIQALRKIILPQAVVVAVPNFGNLFIGMVKGSSLAYMVAVSEIMGVANVEASAGLDYIESFLMTSVLYWAICSIFERIFRSLENRLKKFRTEVAI